MATTTTKFKLIGNFTENLIKLDDIGGYQDEINALMDLIQLPLNNPQKLKQINIMPPKGVLIFGPPGTGKTMTMKALINEFCCQINCIKVDSASLLCKSVADSEIKLKALFSKALDEAPSILFLDNIENICPNKRTMNDQEKRIISTLITLLDELPEDKLILVIAATNKPESVELSLRRPGRFEREIEFSIPLPRERFQILKKLFSKANYDISDERLMLLAENVHSFTGADLAYSCREASLIALKDKKEKITENQLKLAFKLVRPSAMKEIVLEVPKVYWTDIGGMEIVKKKLIQTVVWPLKNPEAFNRIGIKPPRGVLMYGPPGCCKTMIGRALATESGLNFIAIKGPELFNKWVGESERAVREVFRKAKQAAPSILFFDEIDALAGERGVGQSTVGDRVLAQMLTELDGIETLEGVIIVASTNRPDLIDKALLRPGRLDSIIYVPLPDLETRKEILRISFKKIALKLENDLEQTLTYIAEKTNGYSGAEITAVCQEAGLIALENDINCDGVKTEHFIKSLDIVKPRTSQEMINFYETYSSKKNEINIKIN